MTPRKSILCLVPLPPPITGAALASETIVTILKESNDVKVIPYQRGTLQSGSFSASQVLRILCCGVKLAYLRMFSRIDRVYLVISSSVLGNLRDLFFLAIMGQKLRSELVIHLHGANFDLIMLKVPRLIKWLNRRLLVDIRAAIILGETFESIFDGYVSRDKVKVIKNYFGPDLLMPEDAVSAKFRAPDKVKILYLSNLMKEKGYDLLLESFLNLPEEVKNKAELHFAGTISESDKGPFLEKIRDMGNVSYHGCVVGAAKRELLWNAQIFCLPTLYRFEGQPISILEAYASGCCVLTTNNGGIQDIFSHAVNGIKLDIDLEICKHDFTDILKEVVTNISAYGAVGQHNLSVARNKYHLSKFTDKINLTVAD